MEVLRKKRFFTLRKFLLLVLALTIVVESGYFGYHFYQKQKVVVDLKKELNKIDNNIKTLKNIRIDKNIPNSVRDEFRKKYYNKKLKIGVFLENSYISEKITKPTAKVEYYRGSISLKARNMHALKLFLTMLYLDKTIYKITDVNIYRSNRYISADISILLKKPPIKEDLPKKKKKKEAKKRKN